MVVTRLSQGNHRESACCRNFGKNKFDVLLDEERIEVNRFDSAPF